MKKIASEKNYRMFKRAMLDWPEIIQRGFAEYLEEEGKAKINYNEEKINRAVAVFKEKLSKARDIDAFGNQTKEIMDKIMKVVEDDINLDNWIRIRAINELVGL
jgi:uncharacterized protein YpuA (DUF1002 family)